MAITKTKGDIGEAMIMADILKKGHKVAIPFGEDWRFDLIVFRNGNLEKVQCKYTKSDGNIIKADCRSCNGHSEIRYTEKDFDWLAIYDATTNNCYYIPSTMLINNIAMIKLRLSQCKNNQTKSIHWAKDFVTL